MAVIGVSAMLARGSARGLGALGGWSSCWLGDSGALSVAALLVLWRDEAAGTTVLEEPFFPLSGSLAEEGEARAEGGDIAKVETWPSLDGRLYSTRTVGVSARCASQTRQAPRRAVQPPIAARSLVHSTLSSSPERHAN